MYISKLVNYVTGRQRKADIYVDNKTPTEMTA